MTNESEKPTVDLGRRRLAKGGLAAPIVLASMASKNALAFPYQCGLSGKLSNNTSPNGPKTNETCDLGMSASEVAGALQLNTDTFNAIFGVTLYYYKATTPPKIGNASMPDPKSPATLYQVLTVSNVPNTVSRRPVEFAFAKQAVVLYWNAPVSGDIYPLTKQQVIDMFKAVINGTNYTTPTSAGPITLTPAEIKTYFNELYH